MKPRILVLSTVHPAYDTRVVFRETASLAKHYDVHLAITRLSGHRLPGVCYRAIPFSKALAVRLLLAHPAAVWAVIKTRPRLLILHDPELLPLGLFFAFLGKKVIFDMHENLSRQFGQRSNDRLPILKNIFQFFERKARKRLFYFFAEDSYSADFQPLFRPSAVVRNFPALASFPQAATTPFAEPAFFYLGQLSVARCLDVMILALGQVRKKYPAVRLHLFGPLGYDLQAMTEVQALPGFAEVQENLIFHGPVPAREAYATGKRCLAGLALLRPVGDFAHSYPSKIFEYMALGLPVISSDFPLYRSVVADHRCGFCLPAGDVAALTGTLLFCIENPEQARQLGQNGQQAAGTFFNWEKEEKTFLQFVKQVLAS